jgi:hypothetical protein
MAEDEAPELYAALTGAYQIRTSKTAITTLRSINTKLAKALKT